MAELHTFRPLFPGSSESDQLYKICSVCGTPSPAQWPEGQKLAAKIGFRFPQFVPTKLETLIPMATKEAIDLMYGQLHWDPAKRVSAVKALSHPYFEANAAAALLNPEEAAAHGLPKVPGATVPGTASYGADGSESHAPIGSANKLPKVPLPAQKDFPANFLLNSLNGTQGGGSRKGGREGSQPGTGIGDPQRNGGQNSNLPPLRQPPSQGGGGSDMMSQSRYLRMARYQPGGQMQTPGGPVPSTQQMNAKMNGSHKLPSMGPTPTGHGGFRNGGRM